MERYPVTPVGFENLRRRIRAIKEVDRPANVRDIEEALSHGDLRENAEYHAAKERQGLLDAELRGLEDKLGRAQVVDPATLTAEEKVVFGATVELVNLDTDEALTYQVVSELEADIKGGKISWRSPLARALMGKEEGDEIVFQAPGGSRTYEVGRIRFV